MLHDLAAHRAARSCRTPSRMRAPRVINPQVTLQTIFCIAFLGNSDAAVAALPEVSAPAFMCAKAGLVDGAPCTVPTLLKAGRQKVRRCRCLMLACRDYLRGLRSCRAAKPSRHNAVAIFLQVLSTFFLQKRELPSALLNGVAYLDLNTLRDKFCSAGGMEVCASASQHVPYTRICAIHSGWLGRTVFLPRSQAGANTGVWHPSKFQQGGRDEAEIDAGVECPRC